MLDQIVYRQHMDGHFFPRFFGFALVPGANSSKWCFRTHASPNLAYKARCCLRLLAGMTYLPGFGSGLNADGALAGGARRAGAAWVEGGVSRSVNATSNNSAAIDDTERLSTPAFRTSRS